MKLGLAIKTTIDKAGGNFVFTFFIRHFVLDIHALTRCQFDRNIMQVDAINHLVHIRKLCRHTRIDFDHFAMARMRADTKFDIKQAMV